MTLLPLSPSVVHLSYLVDLNQVLRRPVALVQQLLVKGRAAICSEGV